MDHSPDSATTTANPEMQPFPASFPIDIEYLVLDTPFLDKSTLSACSCVCRAWLPVARSHLFRKIKIVAWTRRPKERVGAGRFGRFFSFIKQRADIGRYVRCLWLYQHPNKDGAPCSLEGLDATVAAMPMLRRLILSKMRLYRESELKESSDACATATTRTVDPPIPRAPRLLATLNELSIILCDSATRDACHLLHVICMFSSIGELTINGGPWEAAPGADLSSLFPCVPTVRSLALYDVNAGGLSVIHDFLRRSGSLGRDLAKMTVRAGNEWSEEGLERRVSILQSLLVEAAPSLASGSLRLCYNSMYEDIYRGPTYDLRACSHLQELAVHMSTNEEDYGLWWGHWLTATLRGFVSALAPHVQALRDLRTITLAIRPGPFAARCSSKTTEDATRDALWSELDSALSRFPSVQRVRMDFRDRYDKLEEELREDLTEWVQYNLPTVHSRGMLETVC